MPSRNRRLSRQFHQTHEENAPRGGRGISRGTHAAKLEVQLQQSTLNHPLLGIAMVLGGLEDRVSCGSNRVVDSFYTRVVYGGYDSPGCGTMSRMHAPGEWSRLLPYSINGVLGQVNVF